jgi:hypothetical protein
MLRDYIRNHWVKPIRWFRFTLRTLMIAVALVAVWCGWNLHQVREREAALLYIQTQGAMVKKGTPKLWRTQLPFMWAVFGARPVADIEVPNDRFDASDCAAIARLFPESTVSVYSVPGGTGEGLGEH